uniref:Uncharacterized protein n=1 Tax=Populus trichocarpa TaxID=3694 RepID=A0A3N7ERE2_POPTR
MLLHRLALGGGPRRDVMIDVAGSLADPDEGLGLGDILKPDLIMSLIETLPLEEGLTSHLPEVVGSLNSRGYFRLVAESSFPLTSGFFYLCKKCEADPSCTVSCPFDDSQFYKVSFFFLFEGSPNWTSRFV